MKTYEEISKLLELYWEGETTIEQEQSISEYFAQGNVDNRIAEYAPLFEHFNMMKAEVSKRPIPDFKDEAPAERTPNGTVVRDFRIRTVFMRVAAAAIILLGAVWLMQSDWSQKSDQTFADHVIHLDEASEQEEALEVTKEALAFLASNIQSKRKAVSKDIGQFQKVNILK